MAERVGPAGRVLGIDRDASLGALAVEMLHGEGHRQCSFREHDLSQAAAVPGRAVRSGLCAAAAVPPAAAGRGARPALGRRRRRAVT